ncbi:MAG TPA: 23S rRNA (pseudouridine(1915)-N(3))-methyltransferase RlmH [Steroidobacteraceae bacterium]|nr:23S rRNA (pseudouridine(1915)-N(3))-methyltransferase RlmH [Steroidobacteraceae bacterium]
MRIRVIAVGRRAPSWVGEGVADYLRRLPVPLKFALQELEPGPREGARKSSQAIEVERERLLSELHRDDYVVALDEHGRELSTLELASWLGERMREGRNLSFLIGGPDGLAPAVLERSDLTWSLSRLTLPHALVRVVLAEQLYRAHTVLAGHPYHRQ